MEGKIEKHPTIICRCEDVTLKDIEDIIKEGYTDIESIKRLLRIGMGPCQGRTCIPLLTRILSRKIGEKPEEIKIPTIRPPIIPLKAELFTGGKNEV